MAARQARQLEALERALSNPSEEPVKLSYAVIETITQDFAVEIGSGGFGVVYLGKQGSLPSGKIAVKKLSNSQDLDDKLFTDEVNCLIRAKHENIVRFLGYCADTHGEMVKFKGRFVLADVRQRILCFEYVPNGNLYHYLKAQPTFALFELHVNYFLSSLFIKQEKPNRDEWKLRYQIIRGICEGLNYLHQEMINHLDLKPENVMLDNQMKPKITDFGLSRCFDEGQSRVFTRNIFGTRGYIAPEVIDNGEISFKSDIFSLGIIIIKLLTGRNQYDTENWKNLLDVDDQEAKICIEIAQTCLHADKNKRPTISEIIHELDELRMRKRRNDTSSCGHQVSHGFHGTDLLDVYPLELCFPFQPNTDISCSLSITNRTTRQVGFLIVPGIPDRYRMGTNKFVSGILMPTSSSAITLAMATDDEPPLGGDVLDVLMFVMEFNHEVRELMSSIDDVSADDLSAEAQELGGEVHRAKLTVSLRQGPRAPTTSLSEATDSRFIDVAGESDGGISCMFFHPTEPSVLVIHVGAVACLWNCQTGEKVSTKSGEFYSAVFVPRKQWLVMGDTDGSIFVCKYPTMETVKQFRAHDDGWLCDIIYSLAVHPTQSLVLSCAEKTIKLWDWECDHDGGWYCNQIFKDQNNIQVKFDPHVTNTFTTVNMESIVKIWAIDSSTPITTLRALKLHKFDYVFSDTYKRKIAGFCGDHVKVWDLQTEKRLHTLCMDEKAEVACSRAHQTHPLLATVLKDGRIYVWNSNTYRLHKYIRLMRGHIDYFGFVGLRSLAIGYKDGIAIVDIDLE